MNEKKVLEFNTEIEKLLTTLGSNCKLFVYPYLFKIALNKLLKPKSYYYLITTESLYRSVGVQIKQSANELNTVIDAIFIDEVQDFSVIESIFEENQNYLVLGSASLITASRYFTEKTNSTLIGILSQPDFTGLFKNEYFINLNGLKQVKFNKSFSLIIDKDIILKADQIDFLNAYVMAFSKSVDLVDYKLRLLIGLETFNKQAYDLIRSGIAVTLNYKQFKEPKEALLYASFISSFVSDVLGVSDYSGRECLSLMLSTCKEQVLGLNYLALEKTLATYHFLFSNDLSDVIYSPNYNKDILELQKITGEDINFYFSNLKIPSVKRLQLLTKLLKKAGEPLLKETTALLKVLKSVKKEYLNGAKIQKIPNKLRVKDFKNYIKYSTYLTSKYTAFTLIRDLGVLECVK